MSVERHSQAKGPKRKHYRFRLTSAARTLSLRQIARLSEDEARAEFEKIRFADNDGEPYCPHCGCIAVYRYAKRGLFKCKSCAKQFSVTSGTIFHSRKMFFVDILLAFLTFTNGPQGKSSLALADDLTCSPKTAFVLGHKMRLAMADMQAENTLTGEVEIDGIFLPGHIRQENMLEDRESRAKEYAAKKHCIVTMRERRKGGRSRAFFLKSEAQAADLVRSIVQPSAHVITDQGDAWHRLAAVFDTMSSVNHSKGYSIDGVHINGVECQNLRIRRSLMGIYFTLMKTHAQNYADELSWRDDFRATDNGRKMLLLAQRASKMRVAKDWVGYWRKRPAALATASA